MIVFSNETEKKFHSNFYTQPYLWKIIIYSTRVMWMITYLVDGMLWISVELQHRKQ